MIRALRHVLVNNPIDMRHVHWLPCERGNGGFPSPDIHLIVVF